MTNEPSREAIGTALARVDPRWDAARTERALTALHRRRARRRATTVLATILVLTSGSALGAWRAGQVPAPPIAQSPARPPQQSDRVVRLADGSQVVPHDGAHVVVEHVTDALIAVRVDRGAVDVDVVPDRPRRFEVTAGAVTVTVLGTAFRVERIDDSRTHVSVERGHVDVAWAGGHAELFAGDEGVFPVPPPAAAAVEPVQPPIAPEPAGTSRREHAGRVAAEEGARTGWRDLARASRYDEAYAALGPPADRERAVSDAVDDLLLAADVARLSGHAAEALPWLEQVERDHPSDPRAVLASFTRGRILMDLGRPAEAARQLERVLAMEPGGSLAEDALARAALAHAAAGDDATSAALAERYLDTFPNGRWSPRVRAILSQR